MQHIQIAVIGSGPAGLSAALNACIRKKSTAIFSTDFRESGLYKAEILDNILGTPTLDGPAYLDLCQNQVKAHGAQFISGRVLSIMPSGKQFFISVGSDVYSADTVILATGIIQKSSFTGERELLGRGVSYCATCDGMLYRGKDVVVYIDSSEGIHEANFLKEIGCRVTAISKGRDLDALDPDIPVIAERKISILGDNQVEAVVAGDTTIACTGLFILRQGVAPDALISNLELADGHIAVNRHMQTNISGVFAAGDAIGKPYQVSKACGEGQIAAFSAVDYLDIKKKEKE